MTSRPKSIAALPAPVLYFLVGLIALFPCIILGHSYFDDDLLGYDGVFRQFLKDCLATGHLPLWNPYLFGGQPFWADPGVMASYPLVYPCLLFPIGYGMGLFLFIHFTLACAGMHYWLKNLGFSPNACLIGSLTFALSGFFWGEVIHPQCLASFAWVPWVLAFLEMMAAKPRPFPALMMGLSLAMLFLSGYPQIFLGTLAFGVTYFIFRRLQIMVGPGPIPGPKVRWTSWSLFIWGLLPLLCLAVPFAEFVRFSDRIVSKMDYQTFSADISLDPSHLYQLLFPIHPLPGSSLYEDHVADSGGVGLWGPLLCLLAFKRKKPGFSFFLIGTAVFVLLTCFGKYFPLHQWLCDWIPGLRILRAPFRFVFIEVTCLAVLAASGFHFLENELGKNRSSLVNTASVYVLALLLLGWLAPSGDGSLMATLSGGACGLYLWLLGKGPRFLGKRVFMSSVVLSLLLAGWKSCPSRLGPESNFDFRKEAPVISKMSKQVGHNRVFIGDNIPYNLESNGERFQTEFPTNAACLFALRNVGANNPLSLAKRGQLHSLSFPVFNQLMAIGGFMTGNERGQAPGFTRLDVGAAKLYFAKSSPPFVYAPDRLKVIPEDAAQLSAMREPGFNPYGETILAQEPTAKDPLVDQGEKAGLQYDLEQDDFDHQIFQLGLKKSNWVVFSEINYPGWKAWVDGSPKPIITSNYLFRGLYVEAGDHQVQFRFEPSWFSLLLFGMLLWIPWTFFIGLKLLRSTRS